MTRERTSGERRAADSSHGIEPVGGVLSPSQTSFQDGFQPEDKSQAQIGAHPDDRHTASTKTKSSWFSGFKREFGKGGRLQPFRLLRQDVRNLRQRYVSDWTVFNQLVVASAVYVFFTNILPGITFASDLYVLTGKSWGTIEVVFSTGLCGLIFSLYVNSKLYHHARRIDLDAFSDLSSSFSGQPLTILGVTGPFSVLAENIYNLCHNSFHV